MPQPKKRARSEPAPEVPCTLRFANQRDGVVVKVLWVDSSGPEELEREYARLEAPLWYSQDTYTTHPWRLRDAADGQLLAEYVGASATITLLPDGSTRVQHGLHRPPPPQVTDPRWGTYRQRGDALGIPISAFDCVGQAAVDTAAHIIQSMLGAADPAVVAALLEAGAEVAIIGKDQVTTDLPAYRHLRGLDSSNGGGDYDSATRGLGGNPGNPVTSCGEENLLMLEGDRYRQENILIHEFGHAVMDLGLHNTPLKEEILAAYEAARQRSGRRGGSGSRLRGRRAGAAQQGDTYDLDCYMMANECEYWAEGSQAWFGATVREDVTSGVNTRERVKARDPQLAQLLARVYGDGSWRYPATAPMPFPAPGGSKQQRKLGDAAVEAAGGQANGMQQVQVQQRGGGSAVQPQVQVLVEAANPLVPAAAADHAGQPLLPDGGDSSVTVARRSGRRRGPSPQRRRRGAGGGSLAGVQRRVTRALARLTGACLGTCLP